MRRVLFIIFVVWSVVSLNAHSSNSSKLSEPSNKKALIETAKKVALVYGPDYVPFFKDTIVSKVQVFKKEDYGESFSEIKKQIGKKYYTVVFTYDNTSVKFAFDFAAKVRVWKNTGEPLDVIFGNGMGRNFLFLSFKEQTGHSVKDATKVSPDSITKVPLQIEKEPENIWNLQSVNDNDCQLQGLADTVKVASLTISEKKRVRDLALQVPDSIRERFSILLSQWNFAIDHNPKTRYCASIYSYAELPEFILLKSMGKQIIPLIMERLVKPTDFYLLVLYEAILKNVKMKATNSNKYCHFGESEQSRAIRCVKMWLKNNYKNNAYRYEIPRKGFRKSLFPE